MGRVQAMWPGTLRLLRFVGGFATGLSVAAIVLAALLWFNGFLFRTAHEAGPENVFLSSGEEISRAGGVRVTWERWGAITRQTCRDTCDDLTFGDGEAVAAEVLDARGRRIFRPPPWWLEPLVHHGVAWRPAPRRVEGEAP